MATVGLAHVVEGVRGGVHHGQTAGSHGQTAGSQAVLDQRKPLAVRIEELLEAPPLSKVLTSMPGVGVRTGARVLTEVGDGSTFPTAGHRRLRRSHPGDPELGLIDPR